MSGERACEVCGSGVHERVFRVDSYAIVRCGACGLVFVGNPPSPAELIALYDEAYYEDADCPGYGGYSDAEARKRHHDRALLDELEGIVATGAMFEVGCAYGYFLDEARTRGWHVRGVEPSQHAMRYARDKLQLDVSSGAFTDLPLEPESADVIALWDVIEHLPNPRDTIHRAHAWLRPGGVIAISTGDIGSLTARLHGADWTLMTPPWHQFYFSRATLRRLLEGAGFRIVRFGGDGNLALDSSSRRPRVRGPLATLLGNDYVTRVARRLGAGGIMFAFAQKGPS
jgi:SAM-dependent methyltransferase